MSNTVNKKNSQNFLVDNILHFTDPGAKTNKPLGKLTREQVT